MKATTVVKINPIVEMTFPTLLQCKTGECGGCPNNTGKLLWVPKIWQVGTAPLFKLQYNFFDKYAESTSPIKYNYVESSTSFGNVPNKAYATATPAYEANPSLSPSQMKLGNTLTLSLDVVQSASVGYWLFFRQPISGRNIANTHLFHPPNLHKLLLVAAFIVFSFIS